MLLVTIGFLIGTIGTLIGVGGGFILVPILLFLYPEADSSWVAGVSIWMVAWNASSGSITYHLKGRVHLRAALAFIVASIPGSFLGVLLEQLVTRATFEQIFGGVMVTYSLYLLLRKGKKIESHEMDAHSKLPRSVYVHGCLISFVVGFIASFLGIGGGVIHVPLMANVLGFPVHLATGTSHLILAFTAIFATIMRVIEGAISIYDPTLWKLGLSAMVGAQIGARLSTRVSGRVIMKILAVALLAAGLRLFLKSL